MDRLIFRGQNSEWAICLVMCSNRIAWHEGGNGENLGGVKTSQGMTYLYLADHDDHFDDEFWPTSDLAAPPGTTVDLTPLGPNPEGEWGERCPRNEWTGGVTLAGLAGAGMHLVAPGGTGLTARKSWFLFPDLMIALGADIVTASRAEVTTVIEHRNRGTGPRTLLVDGAPVTTAQQFAAARWAHLDRVGGYLILDASTGLTAEVAERTGRWLDINATAYPGADVRHSRHYGNLSIGHGAGSAVRGASYAYAMLPGASVAQTRALADQPDFEVIANGAPGQGVRRGAATAINFWRPGRIAGLGSSAPACLLMIHTGPTSQIAVSDPTQKASSWNSS